MTRKKAEQADEVVETSVPFPLPGGHYFYLPVVSPFGHHGDGKQEKAQVGAIQSALGIEVTGRFDKPTADAVARHQAERDTASSGLVDEAVWSSIFS